MFLYLTTIGKAHLPSVSGIDYRTKTNKGDNSGLPVKIAGCQVELTVKSLLMFGTQNDVRWKEDFPSTSNTII